MPSRYTRVCLSFIITGCLLLTMTATASATHAVAMSPAAAALVDAGHVSQWLANQTATGASFSGLPAPSSTATSLANAYSTSTSIGSTGALSSTYPGKTQLAKEVSRLTVKSGLSLGLRALGPIGLAATAYQFRYEIQSSLRSVFGFGEAPAYNPPSSSPLVGPTLRPFQKGDAPGGCSTAGAGAGACGLPDEGHALVFDAAGFPNGRAGLCETAAVGDTCMWGFPAHQRANPPAGMQTRVMQNLPTTNSGQGVCHTGGNTSPATSYPCMAFYYWTPAGKDSVVKNHPSTDTSSGAEKVGTDATARNYTTADTALRDEVHNNPSLYPTLIDWLEHQAEPGSNPDPTVGSFSMPDCGGLSSGACVDALEAAGWTGTSTTVTLDQEGANLDFPPGAVVETSPAAGTSTAVDTPVEFTVNPDPLPVVVLAPLDGETYSEYVTRLQAAGHVGTVTRADYDPANPESFDASVGPNVVLEVTPAQGTRVQPTDGVTVRANPTTAPATTAGAPGNGCGLTPPTSALDVSPITGLAVGDSFPFSLLPWIGATMGSFAVDPVQPNADISVFGEKVGDFGSLGLFSDLIAWFRLLLILSLWVGVVLFLYYRTIGAR